MISICKWWVLQCYWWRSPPQILNKLIHLSIVVHDFWTINNQKQSIGTSSFSIMIFMWYCAALTPMHKKLNKSNIVITLSHVHMKNFYFISAPAKHWLKTCVHSFNLGHLCFQQCEDRLNKSLTMLCYPTLGDMSMSHHCPIPCSKNEAANDQLKGKVEAKTVVKDLPHHTVRSGTSG